MRLKHSVKVRGMSVEILLAFVIANSVYGKHGVECVETSGDDSVHSNTSLHYAGNAIDLRTRDLPPHSKQTVRDEIKDRLTVDYDVVLESDHIHIEYQPRRR